MRVGSILRLNPFWSRRGIVLFPWGSDMLTPLIVEVDGGGSGFLARMFVWSRQCLPLQLKVYHHNYRKPTEATMS